MGGMDAIVAEPKPTAVTEPRPKLGLRAMVVEDEPDLAEVIADYLQRSGFDVEITGDGAAAVAAAHRTPPDVVVLDLGLPSLDGVEVCRQLRTFSDAYVVMVTARADEVDTLVGLSVGADDYLTKPFSPRELIARIEAMLRRPRAGTVNGPAVAQGAERRIGDLLIDPSGREVSVAGRPAALTRTEFDLLDVLSRRPGMVFSRDQLLAELWGPTWVGDAHVVDVHIASLRRKLGDTTTERRYIRTIRGIGYRMGDGRSKQ
ncbi:response regulator transcription factor [Tsukamurella paurometabola]|uniref:Response regulator transcription factor n=3 Tax=Tsukamurella TaxID=2060 RepID=A0ABS5NAK0_TSUPA|nr:response regulator transcription factor [Tsukamurella paurometabola]SDQ42738.1 DNA-binding response regulator, OmpR family, contains REC and winged-helix (wHTH) domain [Tsukamurella pulmonis]SUP26153.1 Alkaline phosphatase synthesis transcriptional regulatory protein phoP [Tsukamurella pulmonis]